MDPQRPLQILRVVLQDLHTVTRFLGKQGNARETTSLVVETFGREARLDDDVEKSEIQVSDPEVARR